MSKDYLQNDFNTVQKAITLVEKADSMIHALELKLCPDMCAELWKTGFKPSPFCSECSECSRQLHFTFKGLKEFKEHLRKGQPGSAKS